MHFTICQRYVETNPVSVPRTEVQFLLQAPANLRAWKSGRGACSWVQCGGTGRQWLGEVTVAWTGKQAQSGSQRAPRYLSPQAAHLEKGERSLLLAGLGKPLPLSSPQAPTPPHPTPGGAAAETDLCGSRTACCADAPVPSRSGGRRRKDKAAVTPGSVNHDTAVRPPTHVYLSPSATDAPLPSPAHCPRLLPASQL